MKIFFSIFVFAFLMFPPFEINAGQKVFGFGRLFFGESEQVKEIQDLPQTDYKLCHKYTTHYFLAGIYLTDDGYVLQKKGQSLNYAPLDKEKIVELQASGVLPNPLPSYSIPVSAYIFGYSFWLSIVVLIGIILFSIRRSSGSPPESRKTQDP